MQSDKTFLTKKFVSVLTIDEMTDEEGDLIAQSRLLWAQQFYKTVTFNFFY